MILDKILADKRIEIAQRKVRIPLADMKALASKAAPPLDFASAIASLPLLTTHDSRLTTVVRLIAEVKKASPSKGLIRPDFDPVEIAKAYEQSGASALSVLTDEKYFQGSLENLRSVREAVSLPILRKDFVVDAYQIYEARAWSADAILLIVAALSRAEIVEFMALADELGMTSLVEAHAAEELDTAIEIGARVIGINNRNLQTFETKLETTLNLAPRVPPDRIIVSESGIFTRADVEKLMNANVNAILVGESLMREKDPGVKIHELLGDR